MAWSTFEFCHFRFHTRGVNIDGMGDHQENRSVEFTYPRGMRLTLNLESRHQSTEEPPAAGEGGVIGAGAVPVIQNNVEENRDNLTDDNESVNIDPVSGDEATDNIDEVIAEANIGLEVADAPLYDPEVDDDAVPEDAVHRADPGGGEGGDHPEHGAEGRPPQQPEALDAHNPGQLIGTRIRARMDVWTQACDPTCGRVCAKRRRQN